MENKTKMAVMQPYLFPYIGYFQLIHAADKFVFFDDVHYINRGWVNRNSILLGGKAHLFTVPLVQASQNKLISSIAVAYEPDWRPKFLKTIHAAYARAPYYSTVFPLLESWLQANYESIAEMNRLTTEAVCRYIGITTAFVASSSVYANQELKGQHRVLDICLREKAAVYINPSGGVAIYDHRLFADRGIALYFLKAEPKAYPQGIKDFIPYLSILDYLMFLPPSEIHERLQEYRLLTNADNV